jgi:superfamily I DNA/RNA helicase
MLDRPKIVGRAEVEAWNTEYPEWRMTPTGVQFEEDAGSAWEGGETRGDALALRCELLRARMRPRSSWPTQEIAFDTAWTAFKREGAVCDFTDLIERGLEFPYAPGRPSVIFVDEAQDLSRLELAVIEHWTSQAERAVLVGDPVQALYSWRAASPEILAGDLFLVLSQSYRVPAAVHEIALRIARAGGCWREDVVYHPRRVDPEDPESEPVLGEVRAAHDLTWRRPERIIDLIEEAEAEGEQLMVLATCDYLLGPTKAVLAKAGIPWCNPYTHRYNPIGDKARAAAGALRFLAGEDGAAGWSAQQLKAVAGAVRSVAAASPEDGVRRGGKAAIGRLEDGAPSADVAREAVRWLTPGALAALEDGDLEWCLANLSDAAPASLELALRAIRRSGEDALERQPTVLMGTVHSVKGGEASRVLLFPELSPQAQRQLATPGWAGREAVFRTFYVGATRASEKLYVADAVGAAIPVLSL